MLIRVLLAALVLIGFAAPGAAQECQRSRAPMVTFAQATSGSVTEPCIEIEGVAVGRLFVEDEKARYRPEHIRNNPSSTGAVLGFYGPTSFDEPTRVRVVGRLSDCATEQARAEERDRATRVDEQEAIIMMTGFCHYFGGRVIFAAHVEPLGPAQFARILPDEAQGLGNLSPLADGDVRRQMLAAAQRYLVAVRTGDRAALAAMHGGGPDGRRAPRDLDRVLNVVLDQADSPFASLRTEAAVTTEIFGWKPPLWADDAWRAETARTGASDAIACFSTSGRDAAMLWPIDSKDADNIPGRPYACTRIRIGSTGMDAPASFDTEQARTGVEEPIVLLGTRGRIIH